MMNLVVASNGVSYSYNIQILKWGKMMKDKRRDIGVKSINF